MTEEVAALNFYEELMHNASPDIQRAASGKVETVWSNGSKNAATVELDFASTSKDTTSHDIQESDEMYDIQYNESTALPRETFGYEDAEEIWRTALSVATQASESSAPESSTANAKTSFLQELPTESHQVMIPSSSSTVSTSPSNTPTSCIICIEDFTPTLQPPPWITLACAHPPSLCLPCLAKCISNDLTSKIWNQIKCPECSIPLVYEDIKRLADPNTFAKYEDLSFRSAMSSDSDFVWCQAPNCDFGQLHTTGQKQPIVRCKKCGFRSCFKHGVAWHERLTCDEYDEMKRNPMGFKSMLEREEEERIAEEERQRQRHEAELARAREQQAAGAERRKLEAARRRREEQRQREVEERRMEEEERQKQKEAVWKRHIEEEASMSTVERTTKKCPGCTWPIEKNEGCQHMTCISCCSQWCWDCLADHIKIVRYGNDWHDARCPYHTDNLPRRKKTSSPE
ncbi:uncharacterized protein PAC_09662 [Phialocephala subalpina]|uniref:RBR-type E3 ubiquitin transferase n=1 Tax=Phialocephala subalpina TaxID=576137 RepID=A0A1L7X429_9HELO|nr:uncharacterized protein PAC_09662 [Phialocephala subalpina]